MALGTPSSQAAGVCPISFALDDPTDQDAGMRVVTLAIRPEDLSRQDPSRLAVQQTLGGAWADNFGAGLAQITISGHTGWHRMTGTGRETPGQTSNADGLERFQELRDTVFQTWHDRRALAANAGMDPNNIRLVFADGLHKRTSVVAPISFTLRRSRSRPLLAQYQIGLVELAPDLTTGILGTTLPNVFDAALRGPLESAGLKSMLDAVNTITKYANEASHWIDTTIGAPVKAFMTQTAAIYSKVDTAVRSINGVADSLILVARNSARAGQNIFHSIAAIVNLPAQIKARVMDVAAAYRNVFCTLRNAIKTQQYYDDFSNLYGASNCSSTAGGASLSQFRGTNTFSSIQQAVSSAVQVSTAGNSALAVLASADVVLSPMSPASMTPLIKAAVGGLRL